MPMVVIALTSLLGPLDEFVQRIVNRLELSRVRHPFNGFELFAKIGKSLINSTAEATMMIAKLKDVDSHRPIATCLWRNLMKHINELKCYDHFNLLLDNLEALINHVRVTSFLCKLELSILTLIYFSVHIKRVAARFGASDRPSSRNQ